MRRVPSGGCHWLETLGRFGHRQNDEETPALIDIVQAPLADVPATVLSAITVVTEPDSFVRDFVIPGGVAMAGIAVRFLERLGRHVYRVEWAGTAGITPAGNQPYRFRPRDARDFFASIDLFIAAVTTELLYIWGSPALRERIEVAAGVSSATEPNFAVPYLVATLSSFALVAFLHFWYKPRLSSEGRTPLVVLLGVCNLLALAVYLGFVRFVVAHP